MAKAIWNGIVLAESDNTEMVEGNHYFPPDSINWEYFSDHTKSTVCPWKGTASYYTVEANGESAEATAWTYHTPKDAASQIKDHVAFWGTVKVEN